MNKCPRCENENIKEDYKYCPICGIKLGTAQEVPVQEQPKFVPCTSDGICTGGKSYGFKHA